MTIRTMFGTVVKVQSSEIENGIEWVQCAYPEQGERNRDVAIFNLRADGGLEEIRAAIDTANMAVKK